MKRVILALLAIASAMTACQKEILTPVFVTRPTEPHTVGLWALSEGNMGSADGQLDWFVLDGTDDSYVLNAAKRIKNVGETPNDMMIYGTKMYCAITGTTGEDAMLRVIDIRTGATIKDVTITLDQARQRPRRLTASRGKVYASLYGGGVACIDTATYASQAAKLSGTFSEGLCMLGSSLFVCNSGQGLGNTISVVDMGSLNEVATITVPYNPVNIVAVSGNELWFSTSTVFTGPASGTPPNVHVLELSTNEIKTLDVAVESIALGRGYVYGCATDWDTYGSVMKKISIRDKTVSEFTAAPEDHMLGYKLTYNSIADELFMTQMMGDEIFRFKADGTHLETLNTGKTNGATVAFVVR